MNPDKILALKAAFKRDGYVFIPGFFNAGQIVEINRQLKTFIRDIVPGRPLPCGWRWKMPIMKTVV